MTLHYAFKNKTMIEADWQKCGERVILIHSHKQIHWNRSDILSVKWDIFKTKMKESKV